MNGPIRKVTVFIAVLMAALLANMTVISVVRADSLNADGRNRRVRDAEFSQNRGAILVGTEPIAESEPRKGRFPYVRTYPEGETWSSVTGWYSYDYARSGLEQSFNAELAGTSSEQSFERVLDLLAGRRSQGANISTTLNPAAQRAAVRALGSKRGAAIAMDYTTGEILALVSTPTFDPNRLSTVDLAAQREAWDELLNADDEPLKNRGTREVYPPGSTFKLVTSAAALTDGMSSSSMIPAGKSYRLPNSTAVINNADDCGGSSITLAQALKTSCNTAYAQLGVRLGDDKIHAQAQKFGFGATQLADIGAVASRFPANPDAAQTAMSAIGQFEVAATPLQMCMVAAGVANDGVVMEPYIVSQVRGADLNVLSNHNPRQLSVAMSATDARQLQQMMVGVVQGGTGTRAQISGVTVGGKTGTARSDGKRPPYAWFVAWANDPKVAVAVFVQDSGATTAETSGGRFAGPIAKRVIEALR